MNVVTSFEESGPCRKKLTIEIPAKDVSAEIKRVVGSYRKSVRMPGFRQGKVPASVVEKRFGDEIKQEVLDRLVPRFWQKAQSEKELRPLLPPRFEEFELEPGQPLTLVAEVETRPEIEVQSLEDFDLPQDSATPTDDEISGVLADLRRQHATWAAVDRAAATGDLVVAKVTDVTEGVEDGVSDQPLQVELGAEGVDEEITLSLTGRSAGQTARMRRTMGEDEERDFDVLIEEVKEQELPELDDELASKLGLETVDELREAVAADLERSKEREQRMARERALLEQLRERHPLELPVGVIEKESEQMLQEYAERLHAQGVDIENAEIDWESLAGQIRPEAERRVHDRLLLDAISADRQLVLDEDKLEKFLTAVAAQQNQSPYTLRRQLMESGRLEPLKAQMLREQAVRMLLGEDTSEDTSEGTEPATDSADGA